jgi:hypothetical protein
MTKERLRIDLWASVKPIIEAQMQRSGLTAQEIVNIALVDYFGLSPKGKSTDMQPLPQAQKDTEKVDTTEDDDYI